MSDPLHDRTAKTADEQALDWFVLRDRGAMSPQDEAEFEAWLARHPGHRRAYGDALRLWNELGEVISRSPEPRARPTWFQYAAAAAAAGIAVVGALVLLDVPMRLAADVRSATGEIATRTLPDGSIVTLNTDSAITVHYTPEQRRVSLLRGEAFFQVAHDPARPFVVESELGEARALGTAFVVWRDEDRTIVTVIERRVAVAYPAGDGAVVTLSPGQRVGYDAASGIGPIEAVDAEATSAWRRGKLTIVDEPLGAVIDDLNRYHTGYIRIVDSSVRDRRVSGVFDLHEPAAAINALERSLELRTTRITDRLILVHR